MNLREVKSIITRRLAVTALASAAIIGAGAWSLARPASAATAPAPAAAPIDESSVGPLISLDQAMEALTARVRPAVVNVSVTSKTSQHQMAEEEGQDGQDQGQQQQQFQQFFGQNSPFGQFFQGPQGGMQQQQPSIEHGLGSGVIISPDGYIVTNNHVIAGAINISVTMSNREIYPAKLIGADPLTDLAVIKIEGHGFPSIPWGDSAKLEPGQLVLAFGNPWTSASA